MRDRFGHQAVVAFFGNNVKYIRENYKNYLENRLRESFEFTGVPIILVFRDKAN